MNEDEKEEELKKIIQERIKSMSPNVKIALGSKSSFMGRDEILDEIEKESDIGNKIIDIQSKYLKALKEGLIQ